LILSKWPNASGQLDDFLFLIWLIAKLIAFAFSFS